MGLGAIFFYLLLIIVAAITAAFFLSFSHIEEAKSGNKVLQNKIFRTIVKAVEVEKMVILISRVRAIVRHKKDVKWINSFTGKLDLENLQGCA